jgi:hypothetical protein
VELFSDGLSSTSELNLYGTGENAVKTAIWIAVSIYVLVAIARKRWALEASLYQTLQILSTTLFAKRPFLRRFRHSTRKETYSRTPTH